MSRTTGSPLGRSAELRASCTSLGACVDAILDPYPLDDFENDRFISLTGYIDSLSPELHQVYEAIAQELPLFAPHLAQTAANIECAIRRVIFLWASLDELRLYVGGEQGRAFRIRTAVWPANQIGFLPVATVITGSFVIAASLCWSRADLENEGRAVLVRDSEVARALAPQDASDDE